MLYEGISFISHSVAASFLADTGACFAFTPTLSHCDGGCLGESSARRAEAAGDLEAKSFQ
ncbi:hypothetical protein PIB30_010486, partial [Stylosanthes scabra]|nr:hypothetical protein [Stylosanthes scabra]